MKKSGFSLAEVLITLAIVGFIAAVTLPSLQMNVEKQKVGPSLMKAVNTLEVANSVALQVAEAATLNEIALEDENNYLGDVLKDYTKLVEVEYDATTGNPMTGDSFYATKDGIVLTASKLTSGGAADVKTSGTYYLVQADINGSKGPNLAGKDIFKLYVDTKGIVIPYGSRLGEGYTKDWKLWTEGCKSIKKGEQKAAPTGAETCAGSIVDNGGRILYFYEGISASSSGSSSTGGGEGSGS